MFELVRMMPIPPSVRRPIPNGFLYLKTDSVAFYPVKTALLHTYVVCVGMRCLYVYCVPSLWGWVGKYPRLPCIPHGLCCFNFNAPVYTRVLSVFIDSTRLYGLFSHVRVYRSLASLER